MDIPDFPAGGKKKQGFKDRSYHYSGSIVLHINNKENVCLSLFKQYALLEGAIF